MRRDAACGALLLASLAAACGEDEGGLPCAEGPLVDITAWTLAPEDADPFADLRPADATCDPTGLKAEQLGIEPSFAVETGLCDYATVQQTLAAPTQGCSAIIIRVWHFDLAAPTPGAAWLALAADGETLWERSIPIPNSSGLIDETFPLPHQLPAGAVLSWHVQNHGTNSYNLVELTRAP